MSRTRTLMATTAMVTGLAFGGTLVSSHAMAVEEGPYISGGIGWHKPRTNDVTVGGTPFEADLDSGIVGIGALGWKWAEGFRTEFELGYREADVDSIANSAANGSQDIFSTMGNLVFDIDTGSDLTVSIGAGIGLAWTGWDTVSTATTPVFDGSESGFAYQGILGASYPITEQLDFTLDYRYLNSTGLDYDSVPAGTTAMDHDNRSHNIIVGLRFALWAPEPEPEPVVAQPAPPPPPAPAPMPEPKGPEKFIVFFDFDKSNVSGVAANIINDAADYAQREGTARITATGHADRAGSTAYNLGLSERRAQAVKAELVRQGIDEDEIVIMWKGESENLVSTNDGVREPQNRRVEIIID